MQFRKLTDLDLAGKRVFFRADLNVPQDDSGVITHDIASERQSPVSVWRLTKARW